MTDRPQTEIQEEACPGLAPPGIAAARHNLHLLSPSEREAVLRLIECLEHAAAKGPAEPEPTDACTHASVSARQAMLDLEALLAVAGHEDAGFSAGRLEDVGLRLDGGDPPADQANRLLDAIPEGIRTTVTFEVALANGGPDGRLGIECEVELLKAGEFGRFPDADGFSVRRVSYRCSPSGSAEIELTGEERRIAEAFARRVVPELGE